MTQTLLTKLNKSLLYRIIFYKHFYKFIFLHKPLCEKYKEHTFKIFNLYVCRSCLFLYTGFFISLLLVSLSPKHITFNKYFILGVVGGILTFIISYPTIYKNFSRITKDFIRFYDGIFLAALFVICFKLNIIAGLLSILFFIILRHTYNKKRSGERICKDCPELIEGKTCSGYFEQKEALLKIEEEYSNIISAGLMKKRKDFNL